MEFELLIRWIRREMEEDLAPGRIAARKHGSSFDVNLTPAAQSTASEFEISCRSGKL